MWRLCKHSNNASPVYLLHSYCCGRLYGNDRHHTRETAGTDNEERVLANASMARKLGGGTEKGWKISHAGAEKRHKVKGRQSCTWPNVKI